jgi:hypothetical protein
MWLSVMALWGQGQQEEATDYPKKSPPSHLLRRHTRNIATHAALSIRTVSQKTERACAKRCKHLRSYETPATPALHKYETTVHYTHNRPKQILQYGVISSSNVRATNCCYGSTPQKWLHQHGNKHSSEARALKWAMLNKTHQKIMSGFKPST